MTRPKTIQETEFNDVGHEEVRALAHSLWAYSYRSKTGEKPSTEPEAMKAAWLAERTDYMKQARGVLRRLDNKGFRISKLERKNG